MGRRVWQFGPLGTFGALLACGSSHREPESAESEPGIVEVTLPTPDPLLLQTRRALFQRTFDAELLETLSTSEDPKHARALRIARAMQTQPASADAVVRPSIEDPSVAEFGLHVARLERAAGTVSRPDGEPVSQAKPNLRAVTTPLQQDTDSRSGRREPASSNDSAPTQTPARNRNVLQGLGLERTREGATLSLRAGSPLRVGLANQLGQGVIRLVLDADAAPSVRSMLVAVDGVSVASVTSLGQSVVVTVAVAPGWKLGRVLETRSGARVRLLRS